MVKRSRLNRGRKLPSLGVRGMIGKRLLGTNYFVRFHKKEIGERKSNIKELKSDIKNIRKKYPKFWKELARVKIDELAYNEDFLAFHKKELMAWKAHQRAEKR